MPCVQLKPLNDGDILVFQIKVPEDKTNFYEFKGLKGTVSNMAYNCLNFGLALENQKLKFFFFFHGSEIKITINITSKFYILNKMVNLQFLNFLLHSKVFILYFQILLKEKN